MVSMEKPLMIQSGLDLTENHREADRLWASTPQNVVERCPDSIV